MCFQIVITLCARASAHGREFTAVVQTADFGPEPTITGVTAPRSAWTMCNGSIILFGDILIESSFLLHRWFILPVGVHLYIYRVPIYFTWGFARLNFVILINKRKLHVKLATSLTYTISEGVIPLIMIFHYCKCVPTAWVDYF